MHMPGEASTSGLLPLSPGHLGYGSHLSRAQERGYRWWPDCPTSPSVRERQVHCSRDGINTRERQACHGLGALFSIAIRHNLVIRSLSIRMSPSLPALTPLSVVARLFEPVK